MSNTTMPPGVTFIQTANVLNTEAHNDFENHMKTCNTCKVEENYEKRCELGKWYSDELKRADEMLNISTNAHLDVLVEEGSTKGEVKEPAPHGGKKFL